VAEGPAVAEVEAAYGDQVEFIGIGGEAPGGDYAAFVERTGTDGFTQLQDNDAGELWQRFGTSGRSTFMFVQQDGSFALTSYGVVDENELTTQVERLIQS
jgi:hypothetical protein